MPDLNDEKSSTRLLVPSHTIGVVRVNETQLPLAALLEDTVDGPYTAAPVVLNDVDPLKDDEVVVVWPRKFVRS